MVSFSVPKVPGLPEDNWVWSSQGVINMHLPERYVEWRRHLSCVVYMCSLFRCCCYLPIGGKGNVFSYTVESLNG